MRQILPIPRFRRNEVMMRFRWVVTALIFLGALWCEAAPARQWTTHHAPVTFEHLSRSQGMSENSSYCMIQDRKGFIWLGTGDGLNRYDGNRFLVFRHEANNANSLGANSITCLLEDHQGYLWIGTEGGGLNRLDPNTLTFQHYAASLSAGAIHSNKILSLAEDRDGNIWIGTSDDGLYLLPKRFAPPAAPQFLSFRHPQEGRKPMPGNAVGTLFLDRQGILWLFAHDAGFGCMRKNAESGEYCFAPFAPTAPSDLIPTWQVALAMTEDSFGTLWIGTPKGLYSLSPDRTKMRRWLASADPMGLSNEFITRLLTDRKGGVWVGTDGGGVNKMLPRPHAEDPPRFTHFQRDPRIPGSLSSNAIASLCEDRSGVLWIGTTGRGLNKMILDLGRSDDREKGSLIQYRNNPSDPTSLSGEIVDAILEDHRGNLWIGTDDNGLNRVVPPSRNDAPLRFERFLPDPKRSGCLKDKTILCLMEDSKRRLWAGSYTGGLIRIETSAEPSAPPRFTHYTRDLKNPNSISSDFVFTILEDRKHRLWVGTDLGGLNLFDPDTGTFRHYLQPGPGRPFAAGGESVYTIWEDPYGSLWLGTSESLLRFNPDTGEYKAFHPDRLPGFLNYAYINVLYPDRSGNLWIGTQGGGLNRCTVPPWDQEPQFIHFDTKQGLPSNMVQAVQEDGNHQLWISTKSGLCRLDPSSGLANPLKWPEELHNAQFVRYSSFKNAAGEIFFGTTQGFFVFHPDDIAYNTYVPPIVITDFQVFNRSVPVNGLINGRRILERTITETREITLSPKDLVFSFEFSALHFVAPERNEYAYLMEGLDHSWNALGNRHFVTFTTLPPGHYVFRVKGSNCDGIWNEESATLKVHVLPPWWSTWWFRVSVIAAVITVSLASFRWRTQSLKARNLVLETRVKQRTEALENANLKLQEIDKLKERMAAMLVHDLRSPLTAINTTLDLLESEETLDLRLLGRCRHSLQNMITMLSDLLEVFRTQGEEQPMNMEPILFQTILRNAQSMFEPQCIRAGVQLRIEVPEPLPILLGDEFKVERVISNLIGNALKFTPSGGSITVSCKELFGSGVEQGLRWLLVIVQDTGRGIAPEELPYIFDPYRQVARKDANLGVGLGLSIVQRIMAAHRGRVTVRSQVGVGTVFTLFFPIHENSAVASTQVPLPDQMPSDS